MNITKKFDRAFQWAGEKMGGEAKTTMSDDFKMLETEMALRFEGMERLQRSMNQYIKWMGRHLEPSEDREKALPVGYLGRTMVGHGEEFQPDSEFGNCLITMGRANERVSAIQESFVSDATASWLESLERSLAMMKEYQTARKKLENRRLAYDASISKLQKAKRDDFRLEEELRAAKAKYEESSEDVLRRMQDIQDAEADSVQDLTQFLDAELDYHERCADELRRIRNNWPAHTTTGSSYDSRSLERRPTRARSNTSDNYPARRPLQRTNTTYSISETCDFESTAPPVRMPSMTTRASPPRTGSFFSSMTSSKQQDQSEGGPVRPMIGGSGSGSNSSSRSHSFQGGASLVDRSNTATPTASANVANISSLRGQLRPVSKIITPSSTRADDVFADRNTDGDDTASESGSPSWGNRSVASSATSVGSGYGGGGGLSRTTSNTAAGGSRKAPPPPPPSRSKKPPPPVPVRRADLGY